MLFFRVERILEKLSTANVDDIQEEVNGVTRPQSQFKMENNETNPYDIVPAQQTEYEFNYEYQFNNKTDANSNIDEFKHNLGDLPCNNKKSTNNSEPALYAIVQKKNKFVSECVYASVDKKTTKKNN